MTVQKLIRIALLGALVAMLPAAPPARAQEEPPPEPPPHLLPFAEPFDSPTWHDDWLDWRTADEANTSIVPGYRDNALRVNIPPHQRRGTGPLWRLPDNVDDLWFRYRLRLDDFRPITSGKLPGPVGAPNYTAKGCHPSTPASPGWSARMLFNAAGTGLADGDQVPIGFYAYHLDQPGPCGEFMMWDSAGVLDQNWWYCIEGRVKMNTPGANDGRLQGWVDGRPAFDRGGLAFRRTTEDWLNVRAFWLNVYFGGATIPNERNLTLRIDDLALSDTGRVGCPNRFSDDDGNPHEPNIEWMFQSGYVFGCDTDRYCPDRALSRAEAAALIDRIVRPPATTVDAFDDDDGRWAEGSLNRLAAAGIISGCGARVSCLDSPVTRGELAALLRRAFAIPTTNADRFTDDESSIFETDINAIAAIGITRGCHDRADRFCPEEPVFRDQAATLFSRTIRWWRND